MTFPRHKSIVANLVWGVALVSVFVTGYVLSYAPVVRFGGHEEEWVVPSYFPGTPRRVIIPADGSRYPIYKPVDWLIDNTPLRSPLFRWAAICNVSYDFYRSARRRERDRH